MRVVSLATGGRVSFAVVLGNTGTARTLPPWPRHCLQHKVNHQEPREHFSIANTMYDEMEMEFSAERSKAELDRLP